MISLRTRQLVKRISSLLKPKCSVTASHLQAKCFSTTPRAQTDADLVNVSVRGDVAVITINDVNSKVNAMSRKLIDATVKAVEDVSANEKVKSAVLISGKPGMFIAGADISMINDMDSAESAASGSAEAQKFF